MANWPRAFGGVEDLAFHDPTLGSAVQQLTRKGFGTNPNVNVTKISASNIPLLNAILTAVASSRTPWDHLGTKSVEQALSDTAKHKQDAINVESMGCVLNDSTTTVARRNREVLDSIMLTLLSQSYAQPVYFPPGELYVERPAADSGTVTFPLYDYTAGTPTTPTGIKLIGEDGLSTIRVTSSVPTTDDVCRALNAAKPTVIGLNFQHRSTSGRGLAFESNQVGAFTQYQILRCLFTLAGEGLSISNTHAVTTVGWVEQNYFTGQGTRGLYCRNTANLQARANLFTGTPSDAAVRFEVKVTGEQCLRNTFLRNIILGTGTVRFFKDNAATWSAASMAHNAAIGNFLQDGDIACTNLSDMTMDANQLQDGGLVFALSLAGVEFTGMRSRHNVCIGSGSDGLEFAVLNSAICINPQVIGGEYRRNNQNGLEVSASGNGVIKGGTIAGTFCEGNAQTGTGDGLRLVAVTGGTVKGVKVMHNDFVDYQGTPTQQRGFWESGTGSNADWNIFAHNHTFANTTAAWIVTGANTILDNNIPEV